MTRTIAVTNQKGGSGKTTSTVNLAAALAERGHRVLVVDLDPQASATAWLGADPGDAATVGRGLLDVLTGDATLAAMARPTSAPGVELVPASVWMIGADKALAGEVGAETIFRDALAAAPAGRWDVVLCDCPPALGLLALSALVACRELVVPVEAHSMALQGLASLLQTVERVRRLNPALELSAILPCRVDARTRLSRDVVAALRARFGTVVLDTVIRESVRLAEAPSYRLPVTLSAPDSSGAEDYRAAAAELAARAPTRSAAPAAAAH